MPGEEDIMRTLKNSSEHIPVKKQSRLMTVKRLMAYL